jgi:hypothetical protein
MMQAVVRPLSILSHGMFAVKGDLTETFAVQGSLLHMHIPVKQCYPVVIPTGITARWPFW